MAAVGESPAPCRVEGDWPAGLAGRYYRIGPHPLPGSTIARWGTYPGLLHEVRIAGGTAEYRLSRMGVGHGPSANVLVDDQDVLAVGESGAFWMIDRASLAATARPLVGGLRAPVAHAHADSAGRLVVTALDHAGRTATAWSWSGDHWVLRRAVALPSAAFVHDAQVIADDLVLGLHPLVQTPGGLTWDDRRGSSTWLVARLDSDDEPTLAPVAPCFVWHGGWASSDSATLVMRAPVRPTPGLFAHERVLDPEIVAGVREWKLDHDARVVHERQLTDDPSDFPVPFGDDLVVALAGVLDGGPDYTRCSGVAIVGAKGESARRRHPAGTFGGEFRPVATSHGMVLMGLVVDSADASTALLVLDPADLSGSPLATVRIPAVVPAGLHSAWLPDT